MNATRTKTVFATLLLVSCSGHPTSSILPMTSEATALKSSTYVILYNFGAPHDGTFPVGPLISAGGLLYGVTALGGLRGGALFSLSTTRRERVVIRFPYRSDPSNALVYLNGIIYGSTARGGAHRGGEVFALSPMGGLRVIHSFIRAEGEQPGALVGWSGLLYGITYTYGLYGSGMFFSMDSNGGESVMHCFQTSPGIQTPLTPVDNKFYAAAYPSGEPSARPLINAFDR